MTHQSEVTGKKVVTDAVTFAKDAGIFLFGICRRACAELKRIFSSKKQSDTPPDVVLPPAHEPDNPPCAK